MKFGIFLLMQSPEGRPSAEIYPRGVAMAVAAERLGFDHVWLAEHHFTNYSHSSQPLVFLAHLAAHTSRIRLGTAIVPVPLHNPLLVAEQAAAVDVLSGGRLELGLGKGYQRFQYERLGLDKHDDRERYNEAVDLIATALGDGAFTFDGRFHTVPETLLYPQPLQAPPPLWGVVNTQNRQGVEDAVGRGMNLFTGSLEPISSLTSMRTAYPELFNGASGVRIGTQRPVFVSPDPAEARRVAEETLWNGRASVSLRYEVGRVDKGRIVVQPLPGEPSIDDILAEHVVIGTPDHCIRQLTRIRDGLGADVFTCSFWLGSMPHEPVMRSMELFAAEVMPAFRQ